VPRIERRFCRHPVHMLVIALSCPVYQVQLARLNQQHVLNFRAYVIAAAMYCDKRRLGNFDLLRGGGFFIARTGHHNTGSGFTLIVVWGQSCFIRTWLCRFLISRNEYSTYMLLESEVWKSCIWSCSNIVLLGSFVFMEWNICGKSVRCESSVVVLLWSIWHQTETSVGAFVNGVLNHRVP